MTLSAHSRYSQNLTLKCLILIGLLCSQFAFGGHQLAHDADDLGTPCQVCTGYDEFDDALSDAGPAGKVDARASARPLRTTTIDVVDRLRSYSARASP